MMGVWGRGRAQHTNVSAGSCSLPEPFSQRFRPSTRHRQRRFVLEACSGQPYVSPRWAMPLCNACRSKAGLQSRREFVFSFEATSHHDASQGVCMRCFRSVPLPLPQNQTHTFYSCQFLWQRLWHHISETSNKLLTATLCPGNRRPVSHDTRHRLPALRGCWMWVPESPAQPQPSTAFLTKPAGWGL